MKKIVFKYVLLTTIVGFCPQNTFTNTLTNTFANSFAQPDPFLFGGLNQSVFIQPNKIFSIKFPQIKQPKEKITISRSFLSAAGATKKYICKMIDKFTETYSKMSNSKKGLFIGITSVVFIGAAAWIINYYKTYDKKLIESIEKARNNQDINSLKQNLNKLNRDENRFLKYLGKFFYYLDFFSDNKKTEALIFLKEVFDKKLSKNINSVINKYIVEILDNTNDIDQFQQFKKIIQENKEYCNIAIKALFKKLKSSVSFDRNELDNIKLLLLENLENTELKQDICEIICTILNIECDLNIYKACVEKFSDNKYKILKAFLNGAKTKFYIKDQLFINNSINLLPFLFQELKDDSDSKKDIIELLLKIAEKTSNPKDVILQIFKKTSYIEEENLKLIIKIAINTNDEDLAKIAIKNGTPIDEDLLIALLDHSEIKRYLEPAVIYYKLEKSIFECPICLEENKKKIAELSCGHKLCSDCLMKLFPSSNSDSAPCPLCRKIISVNINEKSRKINVKKILTFENSLDQLLEENIKYIDEKDLDILFTRGALEIEGSNKNHDETIFAKILSKSPKLQEAFNKKINNNELEKDIFRKKFIEIIAAAKINPDYFTYVKPSVTVEPSIEKENNESFFRNEESRNNIAEEDFFSEPNAMLRSYSSNDQPENSFFRPAADRSQRHSESNHNNSNAYRERNCF